MTPCHHTGPGVSGAFRRTGVWLLLALLLVAAGERRLADIHYNLYFLSLGDGGLDDDDSINGDEVALRLVALDDAQLPAVVAPASPLVPLCAALVCTSIAQRSIESPAPRGPPAASSAPA
jgi:hypothetical protein